MKKQVKNILISSFIFTAGLALFSISKKKINNKKVIKEKENKQEELQEERNYTLLKEFKTSDNKDLKEVI